MIDTSMYNTGQGLRSGMQAGQQMRQSFGGNPLQDAMKRMQSGEDPKMILAELQQSNPDIAAQLMKLMGGGV